MKTPRRLARELVLQGLYAWSLNPDHSAADIEQHLRENDSFAKVDLNLFRTLLIGVLERAPSLSQQLEPFYDRAAQELNLVERAALLIAAFELSAHPETPHAVVINEAIEMTKTFGGTDGHKFVNGVLDKFAAHIRREYVKS